VPLDRLDLHRAYAEPDEHPIPADLRTLPPIPSEPLSNDVSADVLIQILDIALLCAVDDTCWWTGLGSLAELSKLVAIPDALSAVWEDVPAVSRAADLCLRLTSCHLRLTGNAPNTMNYISEWIRKPRTVGSLATLLLAEIHDVIEARTAPDASEVWRRRKRYKPRRTPASFSKLVGRDVAEALLEHMDDAL